MKNLKQRSIYFLYYFVFVSISFFNSPYLISQGLDMQVVGYAFSTSLLLSMLIMVMLGVINDNEILSHKHAMLGTICLSVIGMIAMVLCSNLELKLLAYVLTSSFYLAMPGIMDGLVLDSIAEADYGQIRSFGSFGAAVSYFLSSVYLGNYAYWIMAAINVAVLVVMFGLIFGVRYVHRKSEVSYKEALKITTSNRNILLIILITLFSYGVLKADDAFNYNFSTMFAGYTALVYGVVGFFSIVFEASLMNIYKYASKKLSDKGLLFIAAAVLVVIFFTKATFYSSTIAIIITDLALGIFVGLFVPTAVAIIKSNSSEQVRTSILSIYQGAISLGGVIFGFITTYFLGVIGDGNLPKIYYLHMTIIIISLFFIMSIKSERK